MPRRETVIHQAAAALEHAVERDNHGQPVDVQLVTLTSLSERLVHAQTLEQACQAAEVDMQHVKAALKEAREHYDGCVAALRAYCADMRLPRAPTPLFDQAADGEDDTPF